MLMMTTMILRHALIEININRRLTWWRLGIPVAGGWRGFTAVVGADLESEGIAGDVCVAVENGKRALTEWSKDGTTYDGWLIGFVRKPWPLICVRGAYRWQSVGYTAALGRFVLTLTIGSPNIVHDEEPETTLEKADPVEERCRPEVRTGVVFAGWARSSTDSKMEGFDRGLGAAAGSSPSLLLGLGCCLSDSFSLLLTQNNRLLFFSRFTFSVKSIRDLSRKLNAYNVHSAIIWAMTMHIKRSACKRGAFSKEKGGKWSG